MSGTIESRREAWRKRRERYGPSGAVGKRTRGGVEYERGYNDGYQAGYRAGHRRESVGDSTVASKGMR